MIKKFIKITLVVITLAIASTSFARLPDHVFACHVSTVSNVDGIVLIQANTIDEALQRAIFSTALNINNEKEKSAVVKECIKRPKGKFTDQIIQQFYKNMDM